MLVSFTDEEGGAHTIEVEDEFAFPVARVMAADLGAGRVRVAGVRITGKATDEDRTACAKWERGDHLQGGGHGGP